MARVCSSSSWGKLLVMAMLVISVAGDDGTPSSPSRQMRSRQQSCDVYHPGMKGNVGGNRAGSKVCCPVGCGECGGRGCRKNLPYGLSGEDCCVTGVLNSQGSCSDRGAKAPCIIKGPRGHKNNNPSRPQRNKPSRPQQNNPSRPQKSKPSRSQQSCQDYYPGVKGNVGGNRAGSKVCCPVGCGECGGKGCRKNLPYGLSGEDCCVTGVLNSQGSCSDRGAKAPCIIKGPRGHKNNKPSRPQRSKPSRSQQSCQDYYPGVKGNVGGNRAGSKVCCPVGCGECGGKGCRKNLPYGLSGEDCCVTGVLNSQGSCSDRGAKAPCIIKH
ncbi:unnamed protein product [Ectocarpus fasciculatus]